MFKKKNTNYVVRYTRNIRLFKKWLFYILAGGVLIGTSMWLIEWLNTLPRKDSTPQTPVTEIDTAKEEKKAKDQQLRYQIQQDTVKQMFRNLPDINPDNLDNEILNPEFPAKEGVELDQEGLFKDILDDLEESTTYMDIEDHVATYQPRLNKKIKNYQKHTQISNEQSNELFIRKFIENARKHGYELKLNDKLQVISVKKIKK